MLEAKYFRDYRHNYMILQCGKEEISRNYQSKILTSGKIKEVLKCSVRYINGQTYFYYDISSKTTLENYYQSKKMSYEQVKDLLQQLHNIYNKLGIFFMEENKLVILPEVIYYDLTDQRYIGLYYPDYEPETVNPYEALMDYLLDHIDTEDSRLTDCMYRIYEMSGETCFSIEDALRLLEQCEGRKEVKETASDVFYTANDTEVKEPENMLCSYEEETVPVKKKSKNLFYSIFAVLSVGGIAAAMTINYLYELSSEESSILIGCVAAMGVCLLICLAVMIRDHKKENCERRQEHNSISQIGTGDLYEAAKTPIPLEHVLSKDMDLCMMQYTPDREEPPVEVCSGEHEKYGNTVFYDPSNMAEFKLYALDNKNKNHIELKRFPYTIGKMAGCVDFVLSDDSISRIHAKFDKKDGRILLTDMNSTNGTYKNGLRMQPQETIEIEPGDEIRFGNLNYCYR